MTTPEVLRVLPLAEEILESNRQRAHGDDARYDAYKAHVYRMVNFARALTPSTTEVTTSSPSPRRSTTWPRSTRSTTLRHRSWRRTHG